MRCFDLNDAHVVAFAIVETGKPKPNCWTLCEVRARTQMQPAASLAWVFPASHHLCVECPTPLCSLSWWGWGGVIPEFPKVLRRLWTMTGWQGKRAVPSWVGLSCPDSMQLCKGLRVELAIYR